MTPLLAQGLRTDRSFERIYKRHVGDVYRYALAILRNPADAEDVTQTTFLNAYRAYSGGERPRQPQNWLIAIAHNVCRQRFRQLQRRPQEIAYDENVGADRLEDDDRGPSADDLRRALSYLAFNQRAALVMRELEGRSYTEIAEILGLTVAAVETLIFRARRSLREQLEGTLTCAEAERALSLESDGRLPRPEKGPLRAHLRECKECAAAARRQRAQRSAWKSLGALPVPASLSSLFGGGGAALGVKAAAVAASALAAGGIGLAGERHFSVHPAKATPSHVKQAKHDAARPAPAASLGIVQARATEVVVRHSAPVAVSPKAHESSGGEGGRQAGGGGGDDRGSVSASVQSDQSGSGNAGRRQDGEGGRRASAQGAEHQGAPHSGGNGERSGGQATQVASAQDTGSGAGGSSQGDTRGGNSGDHGGDRHGRSDLVPLPLPDVSADQPKTSGD